MNSNASLSDYVEIWAEKGAPRWTPRARRIVVLSSVILIGAGLLVGFFYVAFRMVLGRFW
ncbi:MAG TPA: hypothetical protein VHE78_19515 [Gemmatimonadaceae bacterium]|nr:hypothetical protein [Gemmatimonadaceae bacterium]